MSEPLKWVVIPLIGGFGVVLRALLDQYITVKAERDFPYGILIINLFGTFVLGILHGLGTADLQFTLIGTALLGSFTTFSTWVLDTQRFGERGELNLAYLNILVSVFAGFGAVVLGSLIGKAL